jgi:hypothetical protein
MKQQQQQQQKEHKNDSLKCIKAELLSACVYVRSSERIKRNRKKEKTKKFN